MPSSRPIDKDFLFLLELKEKELINLFKEIRAFVIDIHPEANELLYHTHALTAVFSLSDKLSDAFCMIPIYTNHLNLGFNKGTLLSDSHQLLQGTGNLIRHIPVKETKDFNNKKVKELIKASIVLATKDMKKTTTIIGSTISKIKKK